MRKRLIFVVLGLIVLGLNVSIWRTEQVLANGREVVMELAPVDPRSLMQGDYMTLNFAMGRAVEQLWQERHQPDAEEADGELLWNDLKQLGAGRVVVRADEQGVAQLVRADAGGALQPDEVLLQYRIRNNRVQFATNAFFFQEGTGTTYEQARYGLFRVSESGQPFLTHLLDENLQPIGQTRVLE